MKLYDYSPGPNPRRLRVFLAEKGLLETIEIEDLVGKRSAIEEAPYYEPALPGQFPVLELADGTHLSESMAICRYLERLHPDPPLLGRDPIEEARIEMWSRRIELGLLRHTGDYFGHTAEIFSHRVQLPEFAAASRDLAISQLEMLDRRLAESPHVGGRAFSVADITAFVAIDLGQPTVYRIEESFPNVSRWVSEVAERPAFRSVFSN